MHSPEKAGEIPSRCRRRQATSPHSDAVVMILVEKGSEGRLATWLGVEPRNSGGPPPWAVAGRENGKEDGWGWACLLWAEFGLGWAAPPGHSLMEVPTGLEPMMTELQSVSLPTWPRNHHLLFINLKLVYYTNISC